MKTWCEKFLQYGLYLVVFLTPLLYFGKGFFIPHVTSKTFFFSAAVEILIATWLYLIVVDNKYRLSKKVLLLFTPLFIFLFWFTLSGIFRISPEMSFWSSLGRGTGLITLYHLTFLSLITSSVLGSKGKELVAQAQSLILWFLGGAWIVAISIWLGDEGFNLPFEFLQRSKGGGLIGNSSLAAAYLIFAFFLGLFLLFSKEIKSKQKTLVSIILATIIFSPLFISLYSLLGSSHQLFISARGALAGIIIGLGTALFAWLSLSKRKWLKIIGLVGLVLGLIGLILGWRNLINPEATLHQKFVESSTANRFIFWDIARQGMVEKPILGWGPENYGTVYQKYFDPRVFTTSNTAEVWNDRAHNVFLETGVAGGWPGLIFYALFLLSLIYGSYGLFRSGKITRAQASILGGLVVGYTFQNLFVFDSLTSLLGLYLLAGLIFGLNDDNSIEITPAKLQFSRNFRLICRVIILVLLVATLTVCVVLPSHKVLTISRVITLPLNTRPDHYQDLLNISPVGDSREIGGIADDAYHLYSENLKQIKANPKLLTYTQKDLEKLLEYLEIISQKEPYDYRLTLSLARLYSVYIEITNKRGDQALVQKVLDLAEQAKALSPNDPQVTPIIDLAEGLLKK